MNATQNKRDAIATICDIIGRDIKNDLLRPSDVLSLSTCLIKIALSDLIGDEQAALVTLKVISAIFSAIARSHINKKEE